MAQKSDTGRDVTENGTRGYAGNMPADTEMRSTGSATWNQGGASSAQSQTSSSQQPRYGRYYQSALSRSSGYDTQREQSRYGYGTGSSAGMSERDDDRSRWSDERSGMMMGRGEQERGYLHSGTQSSDASWGQASGAGWQDRGMGRDYGMRDMGQRDYQSRDYGNRDYANRDYDRDYYGRMGRGESMRSMEEPHRSELWRGRGHERQSLGEMLGFKKSRWEREPLRAGDVMTRNVKGVQRSSTLREVAQLMKDENCGIVPVVDEQMRLQGVLTDRDLVIRAFTENRAPETIRVQDIMTDDVEAVTEDERVLDVIHVMGRKQIRRIPVVDRDDRLIGIISMGDLATRADKDEELQEALEKISSRRSFWSRLF